MAGKEACLTYYVNQAVGMSWVLLPTAITIIANIFNHASFKNGFLMLLLTDLIIYHNGGLEIIFRRP